MPDAPIKSFQSKRPAPRDRSNPTSHAVPHDPDFTPRFVSSHLPRFQLRCLVWTAPAPETGFSRPARLFVSPPAAHPQSGPPDPALQPVRAPSTRALARQYPDLDRRRILLDLIEIRGDKGKWFAAAKDEGFLDIALECAGTHGADPSTLVRAARDFGEAEPRFAASVALMAIGQLLGGGGYNPPLSDAEGAVAYLFTAAQRIGATGWARQELFRLGQEPCSPGRELFLETVRAALFRHDGISSPG